MNDLPGPSLLPGSTHFQVTEDPAYAPCGAGEHLYVEIEKDGLTTERVAEQLAQTLGRSHVDIGYAGRKDRHAITRQWFSVHFGDETRLPDLPATIGGGRLTVLQVSRHRNKLRLGHLAGNRFRLALTGVSDAEGLARTLARLGAEGVGNVFGPQRFGVHGATLSLARAWGAGQVQEAVAWIIDPSGAWRYGEPLPGGFRHGPEGRVLGALRRRPDDAAGALRAGGDALRKLAASAAQSAVFNAIHASRRAAGLLHRLRIGDLGCTTAGAPFIVAAEDLETTNQRCLPGVLDAFATAPLPGRSRLRPAPEIDAQERSWAESSGVEWSWFEGDGPLASPGERRSVIMAFRSTPVLTIGAPCWLEFALPAGGYATEVLAQAGIAIPSDRRG